MNPVSNIEGKAYPFGLKNVDTDVIIPAAWLKTISRSGLGKGAFETIRADPDNLFDSADYASREHAAWALDDMGIKAVIAPSFSDIFSGNAFKNGLLTVVLPQEAIDRLMEVAKTDPIHINLEHQTVTTPFQDRFVFEIDPFRKHCLLQGLDEIGLTLASNDDISVYEATLAAEKPWLAPSLA
jgi:3-isopropylmalate/(R)-2-methylmalate dehydratase small subunit